MSSSRSRRPLFPPLPLDPISDSHPSDILSRDSSSSDSDSESIAKRARMLKHAENYLRGEPLYLHSAKLRGPVVKNPWGKGGRQTKRKASDAQEGVTKRLKRGEGWEIEPTPTQSRGANVVDVGKESRGTTTTTTTTDSTPAPSTPAPLRTRPPEATNVPDRSFSPSNSPYEKELLEFKTPVKKKSKSPIEVAPAFSPGTFYSKPKPSQHFTKTPNRRESLGAERSSPPQEARGSASKSRSARKTTKEPDQAPESSLEVRGSSSRLRSSRRSTKEPTPGTPPQAPGSSSRPRSTRNSTKELVTESELSQEPHPTLRPRSTRSTPKPAKTLELQPPLEQEQEQEQEQGLEEQQEQGQKGQEGQEGQELEEKLGQEQDQRQGQEQEPEQEPILDTIAVALPPLKPQISAIDAKRRRPKVDFGANSPFVIAPERPKTKGKRRKKGSVGKSRSEEAQVGEKGVMGGVGIESTEELRLEKVPETEGTDSAEQVGVADVPEPEHAPEKVEGMSNGPAPETEVAAIAEHVPESVEVTSKEPTIIVAIPEPEQPPETPSSNDLVREQVLENWVNRHVAASQSFNGDNVSMNRLSIANLLSPMVESPFMRRNTGFVVDSVPDTPTNGQGAAMVPNTPAITAEAFGVVEVPEVSTRPEKIHSPPPSHATRINVPRSPDYLPQLQHGGPSDKSPTQLNSTNPQSKTQLATQLDSYQSTQYAVLAAQKGLFDAIQESPVVSGPYLSTTATPGRDLLRPIGFFENTQSQTPGLITSFGDGYRGREGSPFKTPGMESFQWTAEPQREGEEESPLKTPGHSLPSFNLSFGEDDSPETAFTPFGAFATPESSPKATSQRKLPPLTFSPLNQLTQASTAKKSVKFTNGNGFGLLDDDDEEQEDHTASFDSGFSAVVKGIEGQQGAEVLAGEMMEFMGGDTWDIDEELRKMAGGGNTTTPSGKRKATGIGSGRRRRIP